jgi:hypothetical protein
MPVIGEWVEFGNGSTVLASPEKRIAETGVHLRPQLRGSRHLSSSNEHAKLFQSFFMLLILIVNLFFGVDRAELEVPVAEAESEPQVLIQPENRSSTGETTNCFRCRGAAFRAVFLASRCDIDLCFSPAPGRWPGEDEALGAPGAGMRRRV